MPPLSSIRVSLYRAKRSKFTRKEKRGRGKCQNRALILYVKIEAASCKVQDQECVMDVSEEPGLK